MENTNALQQLSGKKRTYEDLSRFIGARASGTPNYTMLMGAGCSVSSNIRSAEALVKQWRKEVLARLCPGKNYTELEAREYLSKNEAVWYNPLREYSSLFEKNYDLPRQRRMFVEQEVSGKSPNLGYAYLLRLVEDGYLNTLFTTNFDDLINEAFFQFSRTRPVVCAQDSAISSITVTSKRPKVIKLHGDYLFDDIKSTVRETESLEDNTRRKFIEFGRDFGMVVVGYGGSDRSIMDVLQYLLRSDDYFKNGIYWCIKRGDSPSDDLLKLLWRDRVYFVEIDGFDELMADLHNDLIGDALPIDTSIITNKPRSIITEFCKNSFLTHSSSLVISRDLDRLRKQDEHEQLLNVFRDVRNKSDEESQDKDDLDDGELAKFIEIRQMIDASDALSARNRIVSELDNKPSKKMRDRLLHLRVVLEERAGDLVAAVAAIDTLISSDPQEAENYIRKSRLIPVHEERMRILEVAESVDPFSSGVQNRKVKCNIEAYRAATGFDRPALLADIESGINRSTTYDPSSRNPIWSIALNFFSQCGLSKDDIKSKLDDMSDRCNSLGASKLIALRARLSRLSKYKEDRKSPSADSLIKDILEWKLKASKTSQPDYEWLELDAYSGLDRNEDLSRRLSELEVNPDFSDRREYLRAKSDFLITSSGDLNASIGAMRQAVQAKKVHSDIMRLIGLLELSKSPAEIREICDKYSMFMNPLERVFIKRSELAANDDIDGALSQLRSSYAQRIVGVAERTSEVHDLLLLKRYPEAASIAKAALDSVGWNKLEFGELIVNYELAQLRQGASINKGRLKEVTEVSSSEQVRACSFYLLGDLDRARDILKAEIRQDRENKFLMREFAIFSDERGRSFLEAIIKSVE